MSRTAPTPASTGPTPAEIAAEKAAHGRGGELAPEIKREANPDARRALDQAGKSLQRLEHFLLYTAPHSMSSKKIAQAESYIQRLTTAINDPKTKLEDKVKLAKTLKEFGDCKEFGGPGGTLHQFGNAVLKGLATQDPALGLILAILFFLIKRGLEDLKLKQLEDELRGLPPESALRTQKEAELGAARFEIAQLETAEAKLQGALAAASKDTPEKVKQWMEDPRRPSEPEFSAIEQAIKDTSRDTGRTTELSKALDEFNAAVTNDSSALVTGTPPATRAAAGATSSQLLRQKIEGLAGPSTADAVAAAAATAAAAPGAS